MNTENAVAAGNLILSIYNTNDYMYRLCLKLHETTTNVEPTSWLSFIFQKLDYNRGDVFLNRAIYCYSNIL